MKIITVHTAGGPSILTSWGAITRLREVRMLLNIDGGVKAIETTEFAKEA